MLADVQCTRADQLESRVEEGERARKDQALGAEAIDDAFEEVLTVDAGRQNQEFRIPGERQFRVGLPEPGHVQLPAVRHQERDVGKPASEVGNLQRL